MAGESDTRTLRTRLATPADLESIYHCLGQMVTFLPDPTEWPAIGRRFFEQDSVSAFVAERCDQVDRQQVIGYASVCFETKIRGGVIGHVEDVVVDSDSRRGGSDSCWCAPCSLKLDFEALTACISSAQTRTLAFTRQLDSTNPASACRGASCDCRTEDPAFSRVLC